MHACPECGKTMATAGGLDFEKGRILAAVETHLAPVKKRRGRPDTLSGLPLAKNLNAGGNTTLATPLP